MPNSRYAVLALFPPGQSDPGQTYVDSVWDTEYDAQAQAELLNRYRRHAIVAEWEGDL